ncbi:MAG: hypothetical protein HY077_11320 [Elusimicrobia bacterium]|nr:hypothetical protein [Elusimicrobiota bacterium]
MKAVKANWPVDLLVVPTQVVSIGGEVTRVAAQIPSGSEVVLRSLNHSTGATEDLKVIYTAVHGSDGRRAMRVSTDGLAEGQHSILVECWNGDENLQNEVPLLVLNPAAYVAFRRELMSSKPRFQKRSNKVEAIVELLGDVAAVQDREAWDLIGGRPTIELKEPFTGGAGAARNTEILRADVNLWSLYQLLRLLHELAYEQAFWGGAGKLQIREELDGLALSLDLVSRTGIVKHFIHAFGQGVRILPGLRSLSVQATANTIQVKVRFPLDTESGQEFWADGNIIISGPGGGKAVMKEGDFAFNEVRAEEAEKKKEAARAYA